MTLIFCSTLFNFCFPVFQFVIELENGSRGARVLCISWKVAHRYKSQMTVEMAGTWLASKRKRAQLPWRLFCILSERAYPRTHTPKIHSHTHVHTDYRENTNASTWLCGTQNGVACNKLRIRSTAGDRGIQKPIPLPSASQMNATSHPSTNWGMEMAVEMVMWMTMVMSIGLGFLVEFSI